MGRWLRDLAGRLAARLSRLSGERVQVTRKLAVDAHPLATEVTLMLDRPRKLRFTLWEAQQFLARTGVSVWTGKGTPDGQGLNIGELTEDQLLHLLVVCCLADDPHVSADQLAPHLAGDALLDVVAALMVLIGDFLPDVPEDIAENPLMASALLRLMTASTGRSPRRPWASGKKSTGDSRPD